MDVVIEEMRGQILVPEGAVQEVRRALGLRRVKSEPKKGRPKLETADLKPERVQGRGKTGQKGE